MFEPRILRPVPDPLGNYIRPGYTDHNVITQLLVEGRSPASGLIINPVHTDRQRPMATLAREKGVETILDSRSLDLSTPGGFVRAGVQSLPWAGKRPDEISDFKKSRIIWVAGQLATAVEEGGYTGVIAPTHFIEGPTDPWLNIDADLVRFLRNALDERGLKSVTIKYPLMMKASAFTRDDAASEIGQRLSVLPIDGLWLRLHPFGTRTSGPLALSRYITACRSLHGLQIPLVAEHSGTIGVGLMAFGAVGGIESGIANIDTVDLVQYFSLPKKKGSFGQSPRVYLHRLGAFLDAKKAAAFFEARGMRSAHGCVSAACCPRGWRDMQLRPREHFLTQRASEIQTLSLVPEPLRPGQYMEGFLRPASDRAVRAAEVEESLTPVRKRLESWRGTLGAELERHSSFTVSAPATGKRFRLSA